MNCPATSSGLQTAAKQVSSRPGRLLGLILNAGSATATVTVYDTTSGTASGTILAQFIMPSNQTWSDGWDTGIDVQNGIYVTISGSGASYICLWNPS